MISNCIDLKGLPKGIASLVAPILALKQRGYI